MVVTYLVIGICPPVDSRRGKLGVRESRENQTMGMTKRAQKPFEDNLHLFRRHTAMRGGIADTTLGSVAETAACAEKFARGGVSITLSVTSCWYYGFKAMDIDPHTIKDV